MSQCIYLDLAGTSVGGEERSMLSHPVLDGLVLFARNYASLQQVTDLISEIKSINPSLKIAIDQEGGRVMRFKAPFVQLPAMRTLGELYDQDSDAALKLAREFAWLLNSELRSVGVDINFAPVLDLDLGISSVIGDRAFHRNPDVVVQLAAQYYQGMLDAGIMPVIKHFPGHGSVAPDSHTELPVDSRALSEIQTLDMQPFSALIKQGAPAVMMSHVIYDQVSILPAGYAKEWHNILAELGFTGAVFTDDLSMQAAQTIGDTRDCVICALNAGCHKVLVCNYQENKLALLDSLKDLPDALEPVMFSRFFMHRGQAMSWKDLHRDTNWVRIRQVIRGVE